MATTAFSSTASQHGSVAPPPQAPNPTGSAIPPGASIGWQVNLGDFSSARPPGVKKTLLLCQLQLRITSGSGAVLVEILAAVTSCYRFQQLGELLHRGLVSDGPSTAPSAGDQWTEHCTEQWRPANRALHRALVTGGPSTASSTGDRWTERCIEHW